MNAMATGRATLTLTPYEDTLLVKAQELITNGAFDLAIVVAHTACEISAERAILRAFAARSIEYLDENFPNFNLANTRFLQCCDRQTNPEATLLVKFQVVGKVPKSHRT